MRRATCLISITLLFVVARHSRSHGSRNSSAATCDYTSTKTSKARRLIDIPSFLTCGVSVAVTCGMADGGAVAGGEDAPYRKASSSSKSMLLGSIILKEQKSLHRSPPVN